MLRNRYGQVALMFIVAIALSLVFMAMVMNWNRSVQLKTQIQVAATTTAAALVSRMASYGENQMQTYLEGNAEKCDQNGILGLIIMVIIIVVLIVLIIFTCGAAAAAAPALAAAFTAAGVTTGAVITGLVIALVLTVATIALQVGYIQPKITKMWNKMQQNISTIEDQFLESAVQSALQSINTDTETIPDLLDYDMDGKWNIPGVGGDPTKMVNRFVYHNTERLRDVKATTSNFAPFATELADFAKDLGLDTLNETGACCAVENSCNSVCEFDASQKDDSKQPAMAVTSTCQSKPYDGYPYSYDPLRCMSGGAPVTIAALLGKERVMLRDASKLNANVDAERGPLFKFLWQLKGAVNKNFASPTKDIFTKLPALGGLKYFYDGTYNPPLLLPAVCPPTDALSTGAATINRWRPGDDLFCERNIEASGFYSNPHWANCVFQAPYVSGGPGTTCATAVDKSQWLGDAFDQDVSNLRDFWAVIRRIGLEKLSAEIVFQTSPDTFIDEFNTAMTSMAGIKGDMAMVSTVMTTAGINTLSAAFTLSGDGTVELKAAAAQAKLFVDNLPAASNAFLCSSSVSVADCNAKAGGDRLQYMKTLLDKAVPAAAKDEDAAISPYAIYGWQSEYVGKQRGYRHVVKVEAATPKRCGWWQSQRGSVKASCGTTKFPWIKTEKRGAFERCFFITDASGCVKIRITRWDEDRISRAMSFIQGAPLWTILSGHPAYDGLVKPKDLEACFNHDFVDVRGTRFYIPASFMINKEDNYTKKYGLDCADAISAALNRGYVTEVCAAYYLEGNKYQMRFIPCNTACPVVK